ncbi:hypothetical protein H8R23_04985 [Flavobacterium sp. F-380]|uniref:Uncharacterized protein n=1 Tax=Flavobacterium kayseriense TaxID=2764714 RepID=A0ABR7J5K6_9FLAO|nr:DUF6712 family protein [Flavobacterium kayseriense]MBC5840752.1 hypothetical protein [Flavobacterium kayseriense]MBC5846578.1 hypothetical protein [Flavobacterium kayseriense]
MSRLINTIADLKRHIIVSATFDFAKVLPFAKRVERKIILDLIGQDQYDSIVIHALVPESSAPIDQVKELLEEAVANYALFLAMPTINILITNGGTKTSTTTNSDNADWKDKRDLNRSLLKTYNEALDDAFQIMEENVTDFSEWQSSKYYTVFKDLVVQHTAQFNDHFSIQKNRQTFLALKPYMREVEDQYLKAMLGDDTLSLIKSKSEITIVNQAQEIARKAVVAFAVAKAAITGTFTFTDSSFTVASDQLPWEKQSELSKEDRNDLKKDRQLAGEEYLKSLKKLIITYPLMFPAYQDKAEKGITDKIIRKPSGLFL